MAERADRRDAGVVLVVDDDPAMRLLLCEALAQDGLTVVDAADGAQALEVFARERPDLVLMDVQMPGLDGYAACARLRGLPGGDEATIVMVTGLDDIASIESAYEAGATDFITKPINWPILGHRVRYLLRATAAFRALRRSEARLSHAQRVACLGNWDWDIGADEIQCSDEVSRIFGLETPVASGTYAAFLDRVHPEDRPAVSAAVEESLRGGRAYDIDHRIALPDGTERVVHEQAEVLRDERGRPVRMHGTVQDITERKRAEAQILRLAYHDALTGLPNRTLFKEHAGRVLAEARRHGVPAALIYIDLDRFKRINDTLSHTIGDEVLQKVAGRIAETLRAEDIVAKADAAPASPAAMLSRLGGDEFMVLLSGLRHADDATRVAERILESLAAPVAVRGHEFLVTASIGIAVYPADGEDVDALMSNADAALYHSKDAGRNSFRYYAEHMNARTLERLGMEAMLKKALEQDQLVLHYQPQVQLSTGRIVALEALVRWVHPEMGMVSPGSFIPLAEETGLILPLGEWVLETACAQARAWRQAGLAPLRVAVNLSSHQFRQAGLARFVRDVLDRTALDPGLLELELTESALMSDVEQAIAMLHKLKDTGLRLAVDDFGTGYSSLNYLKRFPLDTLKIDQSFTRELVSSSSDASITKVIIALAQCLNLSTIAEGVETEQQLAFLRAHGCDEVQGYLIGRPQPVADLTPLLRAAGDEGAAAGERRSRPG